MAQAQAQALEQTPLAVRIRGRVDYVKQGTSKGKPSYMTLVVTPAPDPYSSPSTLEVRSAARIGGVGEEVDLVCTVKGYKQTGTSEKTGEVYRRAQNVLEVAA